MTIRIFLCLAFTVSSLGAASDEVIQPEKLGESLGSGSFAERREASDKLWDLGKKALPMLDTLVNSSDPEVAIRARDLKKKIRMGLGRDAPQEIIELVESYQDQSLEEKEETLSHLRTLGAHRAALFLFDGESDLEVRERLSKSISGAAREAARQAMANGRDEDVFELLMMDPAEAEGFAALAAHYRHQGLLEREIAKAATVDTRKGKQWHLALAREAGNYLLARSLAQELGDDYVHGIMSVLEGDPVPLMQYIRSVKKDQIAGASDITDIHEQLSIARWAASETIPLTMKIVEFGNEVEQRNAAAAALALNGEREMMEELYKKQNPEEYLSYLESNSRLDELFDLANFKNTPKDRLRLRNMLIASVRDRQAAWRDLTEAFQIVIILSSHGDLEAAQDILDEPMALALKMNNQMWKRWVVSLFRSDSHQLGERYVQNAIGEKNELPFIVADAALLGGNAQVKSVLFKLEKANGLVAWKQMLMLRGAYPESENEIDAIEKQLLELARSDDDRFILAALAESRRDESSISLIVNQIESLEVKNRFLSVVLTQALNHQDWKKALAILTDLLEKTPDSPSLLVQLFYVQEGMGDMEAAQKTKLALERTFLGDDDVLSQVASQALKYGKTRYAMELLSHAIAISTPDENELITDQYFHRRIYVCAESARKEQNWARAAACYELYSFLAFNDAESNASDPRRALFVAGYVSLCRGMAALEANKREVAMIHLRKTFDLFRGSGKLSDDFFPIIRGKIDSDQYVEWFRECYTPLAKILEQFPKAHNVHNTAAWLASRAVMILDEAEKHANVALSIMPNHAAYLDTMAEIHFAKGNRKKALEYSLNAISREGLAEMMWDQYRHFRDDPFPE